MTAARSAVLALVLLSACGAPAGTRPSLVSTSTSSSVSTAAATSTVPPTAAARTTVAPTTSTTAVPNPTGRVIDRVDTSAKVIALTFDSNMTDAMLGRLDSKQVDSYANEAVIDVLERNDVPATFFLAGKWVERYADLTTRIAANPRFEIGSHSYEHKGYTAKCYTLGALRLEEMAADVTKSFDVLRPFGGRQVPYFRFPGLCVDDQALAQVERTRVTVIGGDVASGDATGASGATIASTVLRLAKPGSIVGLHLTKANAPNTHIALPQIIAGLRNAGFELVTVSDLLRRGA